MVEIFILFLLFFIPGFIGLLVYEFIIGFRVIDSCRKIIIGMIFNLISLIIMLIGLWIFHQIHTLCDLINHFTCLHFTIKYALVIIIVNFGLGAFVGLLKKLFCYRR